MFLKEQAVNLFVGGVFGFLIHDVLVFLAAVTVYVILLTIHDYNLTEKN